MSHTQLSLDVLSTLSSKSELIGEIATKPCRKCGDIKPLDSFPYFSTSTAGRKNTCKSCSRELSKVRSRLRSANPPPPPGKCPACRRHTDHWVLDHCHHTDSFRGYICDSCNLGFGKFNDDPNMMASALLYLITSTQPTNADETTR